MTGPSSSLEIFEFNSYSPDNPIYYRRRFELFERKNEHLSVRHGCKLQQVRTHKCQELELDDRPNSRIGGEEAKYE